MNQSRPRPMGFVSRDKVIGVQFGVLNPDDVKRRSVVEVKSAATYDGNNTVVEGLFDPRMGPLENRVKCPTDGQTNMTCPGYFGHYQTCMPVYNIGFLETIRKMLACVCVRCGKLYIDRDSSEGRRILSLPLKTRFAEVYGQSSKIQMCGSSSGDGCGAVRPRAIEKEGVATMVAEYRMGEKGEERVRRPLAISHVREILQKITDDDLEFMGFDPRWSRPDWMITDVIPVPPPYIRPSVKFDNNQRSEDDITYKYSDIIKADQTLRTKIRNGADADIVQDWWNLLQYHYATLIDNDLPDAPASVHRLGRPLKSIVQRITGKEGRIRGNLMGKRVDFSARTVITGDPNLSIRQVGVPLKIAMNLTVPERVTEKNMAFLQKCVNNGPDVYPGAKSILLAKDGNTYSLRILSRRRVELSVGDIVHRHMTDGDPVLFNRQPSLHRPSMMCHIAKVLPYNTFRMNVIDTKPYNADFDGDEMNMHLPQSIEAMTELRMLAAVPNQIIIAKNNAPVIQAVQDVLLGINRMTFNKLVASTPEDVVNPAKIRLGMKEAMNIMMGAKGFRGMLPPPTAFGPDGKPYWSGRDLFHAILPGVFVDTKGTQGRVVITPDKYENTPAADGPLNSGILNKGSTGIVHQIFLDKGPDACSDFLDNLQNIVVTFLIQTGFSVGLSDLIADAETDEKILKTIREKKEDVSKIMRSIHTGTFENKTSKPNQTVFEERVNSILNKAVSEAGKIGLDSLFWDNRMTNMIKAGSKGSGLNISQMMSCVGQVNVDGQRIPYGYEGRTLPHFQRFDDSPEARGFVENSFVRGLTPVEFFFHAQSGREGLIDTAVKTSSTGYVQRQMIKTMEDLKVHYDYTVRSANGSIVQMAYGEDAMDSTRIITVPLPSLERSVYEIYNEHVFRDDDPLEEFMIPEAVAKTRAEMPDIIRRTRALAEQIVKDRDTILEAAGDMISAVNFSVPVDRIIREVTYAMRGDLAAATNLDPMTVLGTLEKLEEDTKIHPVFGYNELLMAIVRVYLSPRVLIRVKRVSKAQLEMIVMRIKTYFEKSLAHPGEMVGVVAAQSIGEPATQMTLNSFHYDTDLLLRVNGNLVKTTIGDVTENYFKNDGVVTEKHDKDTHLVYSRESDAIEVLSADLEGKVKWRKVEAFTKHPVVNKDGSSTLLKVQTRGGQSVIATKAKSFVRFNKLTRKLEQVNGEDIHVGDLLPVHAKGFETETLTHCELRNHLPPTEFIYGTEMEKAHRVRNEGMWWKKHNGKTFNVPYGRSDSCFFALSKPDVLETYKPGFVYPSHSVGVKAMIPESIPLDWRFGYLIGAYCAEGCITKTQISIANNDLDYLKPIIELCDDWNITYKIYTHTDKNEKGWTSQDIRIYSTVLTRILKELCGQLSTGKHIHSSLLGGSRDFLSGICSGYFGGDGTVSKTAICACSVSRQLLDDIKVVLLRVNDIHSTIHSNKLPEKNNRGTTSFNQSFTMCIRNGNVHRFIESVEILIAEKQKRFSGLSSHKYRDNQNYLNRKTDLNDVILDEIVSIDEVENDRPYVYDLTIQGTRIFQTFTGLVINDTFHLSGISEKSNVTRGVPRLNEILHLSKALKSPSLTVYLAERDRENREAADVIRKALMRTRVRDVVKTAKIMYDPSLYTEILAENPTPVKHWKLQLEINPEEMHERGITMEDLHIAISKGLGGKLESVQVSTTDTNADKLLVDLYLLTNGEVAHDESGDAIRLLRDLETLVTEKVVVRGVRGIQHCVLRKVPPSMKRVDQEFKKTEEYVVDTVGTNLLEVCGQPGVDSSRTYSNHILEVYQVLGIDAARNAIIRELVDVFEDSYINYHHLSLLADKMTCRGRPISVDRHGVNKSDASALAKASFEETDTMLLKAAQHGELDTLTGVTSNIMFGQPIPGGTGMSQILLDEAMFEKTFRAPRVKRDGVRERAEAEAERKAAYCETRDVRLQPVREAGVSSLAWMDDGELI